MGNIVYDFTNGKLSGPTGVSLSGIMKSSWKSTFPAQNGYEQGTPTSVCSIGNTREEQVLHNHVSPFVCISIVNFVFLGGLFLH